MNGLPTSIGLLLSLLAVLVAVLVAGIVLYNRLVHDRERVKQAWSDILVQLRRRHELIPKLVAATRAYADYEGDALEIVTRARAREDDINQAAARARLESALATRVRQLVVIAEEYPELQASAQWLHLQQNISAVESDIQSARRYYNGAVKALNVRVDSFPSNLVARLFGFRHAAFFELEG